MTDWQTETGLFSDYEGTVTDAWFQTDPNVGDGNIFQLYLNMGDIDLPTPDGKGEWIERFSVGPDWRSMDGGKTVQHPTKKMFNKNSQMGRLVDRMVEIGAVDGLGSPTEGASFVGLRFHMEGVTTSGTFKQGANKGEKWESTRNFPTKFLGKGEATVKASSNGTVAPGAKDGAAWVEYLTAFSSTDDIKAAASSAADHSAFLNACLAISGVADDNALVTALAEDGAGSLYAVLKG